MAEASPVRPVLFVGAFWREVSGIPSLLGDRRPMPSPGRPGAVGEVSGQRVIVIAGGVGRDRALAASRESLGSEGAAVIVNVGFAASLSDDLPPPSLVLVEAIHHNDSVLTPSSDLLSKAEEALGRAGRPCSKGRLITMDRPLRRGEQKRELGRKGSAVAADMEAFHLGKLAEQRGIPFLCVKAISDGVDQDLPDPAHLLTRSGRPSALGTLLYLLRNPREIRTIAALARADRAGRAALTAFAGAFLDGYRRESSP